MGLLKKKPTELDATAAAAILPSVDPAPAEAPASIASDEAAVGGVTENAAEGAPADAVSADDEAESQGSDGADALLSMFGSTQHESDDRAVILEMAGDIELTDLMDEVQMVASALNIVINRG